MPAPSPSWEPSRPFRYVGGDVSLDFINTVDWTAAGLAHDRLVTYGRLIEWAQGAGLLDSGEASQFLSRAATAPRQAATAMTQARALRQAVCRVVRGVIGADSPDAKTSAAEALHALNIWTTRALGARHLDFSIENRRSRVKHRRHDVSRRLVFFWPWQRIADAVDGEAQLDLVVVLFPVVERAAALLTSDEAALVHMCSGPDCGWLYVDRSRGHRRRWCAMDLCGTAEKERRRGPRLRRRLLAGPPA